MEPVIIDSKFIRREFVILLACFVAAVLFDLTAIIIYSRPIVELLTTFGYEIAITFGIYALSAFVRILVFLIRMIFPSKAK